MIVCEHPESRTKANQGGLGSAWIGICERRTEVDAHDRCILTHHRQFGVGHDVVFRLPVHEIDQEYGKLVSACQGWAPTTQDARGGHEVGEVRGFNPIETAGRERLQFANVDELREYLSVELCQGDADVAIPQPRSEPDQLVFDVEKETSVGVGLVYPVFLAIREN